MLRLSWSSCAPACCWSFGDLSVHCSAVKQPSVSSSTTTAALQVSHGNQEASLHGKGLQHKAMQNTGLKSWTQCLSLLSAVRCEPDAEQMKTHHRRSQARWEAVIYGDLSPPCVQPSGAVNPCDGWYDAGCNWRDSQEPGCKGESKLQLGTSSSLDPQHDISDGTKVTSPQHCSCRALAGRGKGRAWGGQELLDGIAEH